MATYVIGDVHGCFDTFELLLSRIGFRPASDRLWLVGDLVNRGPKSLELLRWTRENAASVVAVLGNHDLHLIGRYLGVLKAKPSDTLEAVLEASDAEALISWLRDRPFFHRLGMDVLVHAGILPAWDLEEAVAAAERASLYLRSPAAGDFLIRARDRELLGYNPDRMDVAASAAQIFSRIRCCRSTLVPLWGYAGPPSGAPHGCRPWYELLGEEWVGCRFFFGHWARLGFHRWKGAVCLDSGCLYGAVLTAFRLEDGRIWQAERVDP